MGAQNNGRTVCGEIERALAQRFQQRILVIGASRTDAGVHARGQAVHFDVPLEVKVPITSQKLEVSLNALLPHDVRVYHVEPAPERDELGRPWHAIRWATGKLYSYRLQSGGILDPLLRRQWGVHHRLGRFTRSRIQQDVHGELPKRTWGGDGWRRRARGVIVTGWRVSRGRLYRR